MTRFLVLWRHDTTNAPRARETADSTVLGSTTFLFSRKSSISKWSSKMALPVPERAGRTGMVLPALADGLCVHMRAAARSKWHTGSVKRAPRNEIWWMAPLPLKPPGPLLVVWLCQLWSTPILQSPRRSGQAMTQGPKYQLEYFCTSSVCLELFRQNGGPCLQTVKRRLVDWRGPFLRDLGTNVPPEIAPAFALLLQVKSQCLPGLLRGQAVTI